MLRKYRDAEDRPFMMSWLYMKRKALKIEKSFEKKLLIVMSSATIRSPCAGETDLFLSFKKNKNNWNKNSNNNDDYMNGTTTTIIRLIKQ